MAQGESADRPEPNADPGSGRHLTLVPFLDLVSRVAERITNELFLFTICTVALAAMTAIVLPAISSVSTPVIASAAVLLTDASSSTTNFTKPVAPSSQSLVTQTDSLTLTLAPRVTIEMVRIPAGEFWMGSDPAKDKYARPEEQPQHQVDVSEFYIGKYPVTYSQYAVFANADKRNWTMPSGKENYPVASVSWNDAVAFCQWLSQQTGRTVRLPTEAEWEKAARSTDRRIYPWGNQWDPTRLNSIEGGIGDTTPVGKYSPAGDSPYGVADMAGNVFQWTSSLSGKEGSNTPTYGYPFNLNDGRENQSSTDWRVLRGGSFKNGPEQVRSAYRYGYSPTTPTPITSFRVAVSPLSSAQTGLAITSTPGALGTPTSEPVPSPAITSTPSPPGPPGTVPPWIPIAGAGFAVIALVFLMIVILLAIAKREIPHDSRFILSAFLSLSVALSFAFLGGTAVANGAIDLPVLGKTPLSFALQGGIAVFAFVLALCYAFYVAPPPATTVSPTAALSAATAPISTGAPTNSSLLAAPVPIEPSDGSTVKMPDDSSLFTLEWSPVDGASNYTVEIDCLGCGQHPNTWYSLAGSRSPWFIKPGVGFRNLDKPMYSSDVHIRFRESNGRSLRWRVWAVDSAGKEGEKSDWCQVSFQEPDDLSSSPSGAASAENQPQQPKKGSLESGEVQPNTSVIDAPSSADSGEKDVTSLKENLASMPDILVIDGSDGSFHLELVRVPAGEFWMGSDPAKDKDAQPEEQPPHQVYVSEFYIGKYPITNAQYAVYARVKNIHFDPPIGKENHPVTSVSWGDAAKFCLWLREEDETKRYIRLPTEAEWEKAARGTDGQIYPWGDGWADSRANTVEGGVHDTTPVGEYSPFGDSPYHAADMSGNVWEWTADRYNRDEYKERAKSSSPVEDPTGPSKGDHRVLRGGSWNYSLDLARAACRDWDTPDTRNNYYGFRVVAA